MAGLFPSYEQQEIVMSMSKTDAIILNKARAMAESGAYRGWRQIETHLRVKYPRVRIVLDDDFIRRELDATCKGGCIYTM